MSLFLLIFLLIYGSFHLYAGWKIYRGIPLTSLGVVALVLFLLLMTLSPILVRLAERVGLAAGVTPAAYVAFTWMGLLFLFVSINAGLDLLRLGLFLAAKLRSAEGVSLTASTCLKISTALTLLLYLYGLYEANDLRLEHLVLRSAKIPPRSTPLRVVQISDVHLGIFVRANKLRRIVNLVREADPDILVSTGDLVDGQPHDLDGESALLAALHPRLGKYAVTGNHEFYAGLEPSLAFTRAAGFKVLRNEAIQLSPISIVGVDDHGHSSMDDPPATGEAELLTSLPADRFTLLLKHRPDIVQQSLGRFDLQLSGHTHQGQIFPFNLLVHLFYPYPAGRIIDLAKGYLYVSRGSATWGPPIRVLAPPEVTVIDLLPPHPSSKGI